MDSCIKQLSWDLRYSDGTYFNMSFVNCNFPGKTEVTAGELKKILPNWNVMKVLKYVAEREGISVKTIELPTEE